jgi:hypothetical protein
MIPCDEKWTKVCLKFWDTAFWLPDVVSLFMISYTNIAMDMPT